MANAVNNGAAILVATRMLSQAASQLYLSAKERQLCGLVIRELSHWPRVLDDTGIACQYAIYILPYLHFPQLHCCADDCRCQVAASAPESGDGAAGYTLTKETCDDLYLPRAAGLLS